MIGFAGVAGASTTYKATSASTAASPAGFLTRAKATTGAWSAAASGNWFDPTQATGIKQAAADTVPGAVANITSTLGLNVLVNKTLVDSATSNIVLDGSATIALEYI